MRLGRPLWALLFAVALLTACGTESSDENPSNSSEATAGPLQTRVVATAPGGEVVEFTDFSVACRPSEDEQPPAQIVFAASGFGDAEKPREPEGPAMIIETADSADGTTVELPHIEEYGNEETFISVFITETGDESELSDNTVSVRGYVAAE